jgi:PTH1 family peptidyl-tRNA hydrolase
MKPQTYMNLSGEAIAEAASFYKIPAEHILVLCDDISFAPGHLRIRRKGSAGGHNGLKSIISSLGSDAFVRLRLGVGQKPSPEYDLVSWVLGKFSLADTQAVKDAAARAGDAVALWLSGKEEEALSRYSK